MKYILSSCIGLLWGCSSVFVLDTSFEKVQNTMPVLDIPYFSDTESPYLYRANFEFFEKHSLTGLLVIKKISENEHRVVVTTDFCNTILDFSMVEKQLKMNYIQKDLDRKALRRVLALDFGNLLENRYEITEKRSDKATNVWISVQKKATYYWFGNEELHFFKQIYVSKSKKYTTFVFESENGDKASRIAIEHHTIPLKITLNQL